MGRRNAHVLLFVVAATTLVMLALPALAEEEFPAMPAADFSLGIDEIPGLFGTFCGLNGSIYDDYNDGYNVEFSYPIQPVISDDMTVVYWQGNEGQKWACQCFDSPLLSGDYQWEGFVEVGENDPRSSIPMSWVVTNDQMNLNWMVQLYRRDTRGLVFRNFIEPFTSEQYQYDIPVSRSGYDLLVAAWSPEAAVPEPGTISVLGFSLMALLGFATRMKYKH